MISTAERPWRIPEEISEAQCLSPLCLSFQCLCLALALIFIFLSLSASPPPFFFFPRLFVFPYLLAPSLLCSHPSVFYICTCLWLCLAVTFILLQNLGVRICKGWGLVLGAATSAIRKQVGFRGSEGL